MERNRMEEEFKEKLNQREIAPSAHAWDRLDAMLNEKESVKVVPIRSYKWLYIAAGFLGFILIATMFFKDAKPGTANQVVVEDVKENPAQNNTVVTPSDTVGQVKTEQNVLQIQQTQVAVSQPKQQKVRQQTNKVYVPSTMKQDQNEMVAQVQKQSPATNNKIINQSINVIPSAVEGPVNAKADEQLASINPKFQDPKAIKVDANSLLSQVDGELDMSFREKVIKLASKKYQNVKVALANRNQE